MWYRKNRFWYRKRRWKHKKKSVRFQVEKPVHEFLAGSVVLQVWKKKSRKNTEYYSLTISRWQTNGKTFWHTKHLFPSDIDDVVETFHKFVGDFQRQKRISK